MNNKALAEPKHFTVEIRAFLFRLGLGLLVIGLIWLLFQPVETKLVTAMYEGKSLNFLNRMIEGQSVHPLAYYVDKVRALSKSVLIWGSATWLCLISLIQLARTAPNCGAKFFTHLLVIGISVAFSLLFAEIAVRMAGIEPLPSQKNIVIEPGGRWAIPHPQFGYSLIPGQYKAKFPDGYVCTMTHSEDGHRITHISQPDQEKSAKPQLWIFGCSFTYGFSINDDETYPWQLQKRLPEYEIVNFGVPGYGTLQALLQFQEALKTGGKPVAVIYAYVSFHDERNTLLEKARIAIVRGTESSSFYRLPRVRFDPNDQLTYSYVDAKSGGLPFTTYSALLRLIEHAVFELEDDFVHSHKVTQSVIADFDHLAKQNGIQFVLAGIDRDSRQILDELTGGPIQTVDISVDLSGTENRNWPHDSHPNARANRIYAQKLGDYLTKEVLQS